MSRKFYYSAALLLGALLVLAAPAAQAQAEAASVVDKYRLQKTQDPERAEQWAFCAALAYAREHYGAEEFRDRARNLVASLKQVVADSSVCPCEDAMPLSLWYGNNVPRRPIAGQPVRRPFSPPRPAPVPSAPGPSAPGIRPPAVPYDSGVATANTSAKAGGATKGVVGGGGAARPGPRPTGTGGATRPGGPAGSGALGGSSSNRNGSTGPRVLKSVQGIPIPNFSSQSGVLGDGLWGTKQGVYLAFVPNTDLGQFMGQLSGDLNNLKLPGTHVYKLHNSDWNQSIQDRPLISFYPISSLNEGPTEMCYYWSGPITPREMNRMLENNVSPASAGKCGLYSKNNGVPALDFIPPTTFMKLVSDRGTYRHQWALGPPPPAGSGANALNVGAATLYISANKVGANREDVFDNYDLSGELPEFGGGEMHLVASDHNENVHAWIGAGQTLLQAELDGKVKNLDLAAHGARGTISKMRCKDEVLWVLCGADLFRVANKMVRKFYTIRAGQPSFAVDRNYIFTNDGNKIDLSQGQPQSFLGDAGASATQQTDYDYLTTHLGSCQLECTDDSSDSFLYALDVTQGVVYRIQK